MFVKQVKANETGVMYRRIGNTLYKVRVYTSQTDGETVKEKIMRLVEKEAIQTDLFCGMITTPQMSQPPERSSE